MSRRPESERSDWTDLDLLTREEAHGRLVKEIAASEARLAELGEADGAERELLDTRLRALREAAEDLIPGDTTNRGGHGTR
jgi:cell division FtsZ-interacting protein ZapD